MMPRRFIYLTLQIPIVTQKRDQVVLMVTCLLASGGVVCREERSFGIPDLPLCKLIDMSFYIYWDTRSPERDSSGHSGVMNCGGSLIFSTISNKGFHQALDWGTDHPQVKLLFCFFLRPHTDSGRRADVNFW
jgi:hypothetical protein